MDVNGLPAYSVVAEENLEGTGAFVVDFAVIDADFGDFWGLLEIDIPPGVGLEFGVETKCTGDAAIDSASGGEVTDTALACGLGEREIRRASGGAGAREGTWKDGRDSESGAGLQGCAFGVGVEAVIEANERGLGGLEFGRGEIRIGIERGAEGVAGAAVGVGDITDRVGDGAIELIAECVEGGGILCRKGERKQEPESKELHGWL